MTNTLLLLLVSLALGAAIGLERELAGKPAGLRTHMIVCAAATLLVSLGDVIVSNAGIADRLVRSDPIRIIEAVITGVTFLGAGTIIRERSDVEGLTTAASLFYVTAIGIAVALGQFLVAVGATAILIITLRGLKFSDRWLKKYRNRNGKA